MICTMASFCRLSTKVGAAEESERNRGEAHEKDSSQKGGSALSAGESRLIMQEVRQAAGLHLVMVLWDLTKLFDSMDTRWLIQELQANGYPAWKTAITMVVHAAPRRLKIAEAVGEVIPRCGGSIVAGWLRSLYDPCGHCNRAGSQNGFVLEQTHSRPSNASSGDT